MILYWILNLLEPIGNPLVSYVQPTAVTVLPDDAVISDIDPTQIEVVS